LKAETHFSASSALVQASCSISCQKVSVTTIKALVCHNYEAQIHKNDQCHYQASVGEQLPLLVCCDPGGCKSSTHTRPEEEKTRFHIRHYQQVQQVHSFIKGF